MQKLKFNWIFILSALFIIGCNSGPEGEKAGDDTGGGGYACIHSG